MLYYRLYKDNQINFDVFREVQKNDRVLDVGCFNGFLGKALIKEKNCIVDGIDLDEKFLYEARKHGYRRTFLADFNSGMLPDISSGYDTIVFADVLEHLVEPEKILRWAAKLLERKKADSKIIICIPNIAFFLFRIKLFFGIFSYDEGMGTMNTSHLRFFTADSFSSLLAKNGFKVNKLYAANTLSNKYFLIRFLAKFWPNMFGYQIIYVVCPVK